MALEQEAPIGQLGSTLLGYPVWAILCATVGGPGLLTDQPALELQAGQRRFWLFLAPGSGPINVQVHTARIFQVCQRVARSNERLGMGNGGTFIVELTDLAPAAAAVDWYQLRYRLALVAWMGVERASAGIALPLLNLEPNAAAQRRYAGTSLVCLRLVASIGGGRNMEMETGLSSTLCLGSVEMSIAELLQLREGMRIELERPAELTGFLRLGDTDLAQVSISITSDHLCLEIMKLLALKSQP